MQVSELLQDDAAAALCTLTGWNYSPNQQLFHSGCAAASERQGSSDASTTQTVQRHPLVHSILPQQQSQVNGLVRQYSQAKDSECLTQSFASCLEQQSIPSGETGQHVPESGEQHSGSRPRCDRANRLPTCEACYAP